jgi:hypothetical protein
VRAVRQLRSKRRERNTRSDHDEDGHSDEPRPHTTDQPDRWILPLLLLHVRPPT